MTKEKVKTYCVCCPTWEIKNPDRCSNTKIHEGKKLFFCTKKCKEKFEKTILKSNK